MRQKLVLWFLLVLTGLVIGFILQYSRLQRVQEDLSASTKQLGSCKSSQRLAQLRDTTTMMYLNLLNVGHGRCLTDLENHAREHSGTMNRERT